MNISSRTVHANGIRQHYLEAGDGPPVVLLHGFPETSYAWRHQLPELAKKYREIARVLSVSLRRAEPAADFSGESVHSSMRRTVRLRQGVVAARFA